jgi:predicted nucleotidyltransferase
MKIESKIKNIIEKVFTQKGLILYSIFLFGSRARGDFRDESDFDILVITEDELPQKERRNLVGEILMALHEEIRFISFDVLIKSRRNFEEEKDIVNTISNEVFLEGTKL